MKKLSPPTVRAIGAHLQSVYAPLAERVGNIDPIRQAQLGHIAMSDRARLGDGLDDALEQALQMLSSSRRAAILLGAEVERLLALLPDTAEATAARSLWSRERAQIATDMRAQGMTVRAVAKEMAITERHVYRLTKGKTFRA